MNGSVPRPPWPDASARLEKFFADHVRPLDAMPAFEGSEDALPEWEWLHAFDAQLGGLDDGRNTFGLGWRSGRDPRGQCSMGGVAWRGPEGRVFSEGSTRRPDDARPLVLIGTGDRDFSLYGDQEQVVYAVYPVPEIAYALAANIPTFFERRALARELSAKRETGDETYVVVDRHVGEPLARTLALPAVDHLQGPFVRAWYDGELLIWEHGFARGRPGVATTAVEGTDRDRVADAARTLYRLANRGRKRPRQPRVAPTTPEVIVRIVGWPNAHLYDLHERLSGDKKITVVLEPTYP